jgi:hypothetical protein
VFFKTVKDVPDIWLLHERKTYSGFNTTIKAGSSMDTCFKVMMKPFNREKNALLEYALL